MNLKFNKFIFYFLINLFILFSYICLHLKSDNKLEQVFLLNVTRIIYDNGYYIGKRV